MAKTKSWLLTLNLIYLNSFFTVTARCWNYLSIEGIPLTYDLNGFKSGSDGHILSVGSF